MSNVIIAGGRGQLGRTLAQLFLQQGWQVWAPSRAEWDITEELRMADCGCKIDELKAGDILINCAAMTNVDGCEAKPELAYKINAEAAGRLASLCGNRQWLMIQISTDYVFSGSHHRPYTENDEPKPKSVYGKSKWKGEQLVQAAGANYYILRTAGLYGHGGAAGKGGHTMVDFILGKARAGETLKLVFDQYSSPTYARHLAEAIFALLQKRPDQGVYHAANRAGCSWLEFGQEVLRVARLPANVEPVPADFFGKRPAPRPQYSVLATDKLAGVGIAMPNWKKGIADYLAKTGPGNY